MNPTGCCGILTVCCPRVYISWTLQASFKVVNGPLCQGSVTLVYSPANDWWEGTGTFTCLSGCSANDAVTVRMQCGPPGGPPLPGFTIYVSCDNFATFASAGLDGSENCEAQFFPFLPVTLPTACTNCGGAQYKITVQG